MFNSTAYLFPSKFNQPGACLQETCFAYHDVGDDDDGSAWLPWKLLPPPVVGCGVALVELRVADGDLEVEVEVQVAQRLAKIYANLAKQDPGRAGQNR